MLILPDKGPIRGLGWSEDEKLIVVSQDGTVRCYLNLSDDFTPFTLGHVSKESLLDKEQLLINLLGS
jgi:hypothetical protein